MYNQYFGLQKAPFELTPDPDFLYVTAGHREALAAISYAMLAHKGFVVLTGPAGTGKTTLLTHIFQHLPTARVQSSIIVNPTLTPAEFLEATLMDFGIQEIPASKPQRIAELQRYLWQGHQEGKTSVLVIDEAHTLNPAVLEEIRLLGNFESARAKLLQIVLVGQSELGEMLGRESLTQFKQRVAWWLAIEPLRGAADVEGYVRHRWAKAGGREAPFAADALEVIYQASRGIPRVINVVCDHALLLAFSERAPRVEARHVVPVCRELRVAVNGAPAAAAPALAPRVEAFPMKTLERYQNGTPRHSLLGRVAGKLRLAQRTETA